MKEFEGVYLGFAPTDESDVGLGEIEITIRDNTVRTRMASGLKIEEEEFSTGDFKLMTREELRSVWNKSKEGDTQYLGRTIGFKGRAGHPKFIFLRNPTQHEFALLVRTDGMGEMLGPTVLFNSAQVAQGIVEELIRDRGENAVPRLRNGGRAESENN